MDQQLEILINRDWVAPWADRVLAFVSDFGAWAPWLILLLVLGALLGDFKFRVMLLAAGLAIGFSDGIGVNLLKHAVGRPRPSQVEPGVRMVSLGSPPSHLPKVLGVLSAPNITYPQGNQPPEIPGMLTAERPTEGRSFPSGHAANNMAVATVLLLFYRRRGWIYLPVALLICYSRIYTGSHWPLDVLAGILLGIGGGWLATFSLEFCWKRYGSMLTPDLAAAHPSLFETGTAR
jgi:undecaprenyl-diphosphatase